MNDGNASYFLWALVLAILAGGRAILIRRKKLETLFSFLGWIEVGILGLMLLTLVSLGGLQIVLRNVFHSGVLWADPLMHHMVLWLGCLGAALATCKAQHINIDIFSRLLPSGMNAWRRSVVYGATAAATFMLGISSWKLVQDEKMFGEMAFSSVPVWVLQLILPIAFFMISYRSVVNLLIGLDADPLEGESFQGDPLDDASNSHQEVSEL
ncbi:MAG: TRAP transporter small permease [bacterium]|nr:TRAP transporter small permease [bacterium]